ncbi:hypothetical protein EMCRGX_G018366 [Ephydatia muelleri]
MECRLPDDDEVVQPTTVIHMYKASTPVHALTLRIKNHHKMADYLTPGRGVVKTSGTLKKRCGQNQWYPEVDHHHKMAAYLTPGRAMPSPYVLNITTRWLPISYSRKGCGQNQWYPEIDHALTLRIKYYHKMAAYLTPGRGVVKTSDTLNHALTLRIKYHHKMAAYLTPGRGVVKTSGTLKLTMPSPYVLKIPSRWLPILLQEGVWSKPRYPEVDHVLTLRIKNPLKMAAYLTPGRGVVTTKPSPQDGCLSYSRKGCGQNQWYPEVDHALTLRIEYHHKMAAYLTPGRGVVKTSGTLNHAHTLCIKNPLKMAAYLTPGRGVVKTKPSPQDGCLSYSRKGCGQNQWYPEVDHALTLRIEYHHKMAAYLTPGRGVVKTSGTLKYPEVDHVLTLRIKNYLKMAAYLTPGRGVVKTSAITTRWLPILLQEGVWSNQWYPEVEKRCGQNQWYPEVDHHHKMAAYLTPGRGVVKTSDTLNHALTLRIEYHHKMAAYLTPGRGVVKTSGTLKKWCDQNQWYPKVDHVLTLRIKNPLKMAAYLTPGRGVVKTKGCDQNQWYPEVDHVLTLRIKNHLKMAAYHTPGRGVVKTKWCDQNQWYPKVDHVLTLRIKNPLKMAAYLTPGRGVVKTKGCGQNQWYPEVDHHHKMAAYLTPGRGVVKTSAITTRWLPIVLKEGVWSKPVVPRSRKYKGLPLHEQSKLSQSIPEPHSRFLLDRSDLSLLVSDSWIYSRIIAA